MVRYRNVKTGRVLERPGTDEWLEASSGWTREEQPEAPAEEKHEEDDDGRS